MIRQAFAPNGSEASPMSPSSKTWLKYQNCSAPNHVAKTIAKTIGMEDSTSLIKSSAFFVFLKSTVYKNRQQNIKK